MKRVQLFSLGTAAALCLAFVANAHAQQHARFTYTQTDATTGAGVIQPFTYDPGDGGGPILFPATPMPAATVVNPGTGLFVGRQTVAGGNAVENNAVPGLAWSGSVSVTGTRGLESHTIQIPLRFAPEVNQTPTDISDYEWSVIFGDDAVGGSDVVTTANPRFAMWFSRDPVVDNVETPNTFQRYTQQTHAFTAGPNVFTNTHLTTTTGTPPLPIPKDATDPGAPSGVDAAGRDLAFYFGWRDQGTFAAGSPQVFMLDDITVGGLLLIPEPGTMLGLAGVAMLGLMRRRA